MEISAPVQTMTRAISADRLAQEAQAPRDPGPFNPRLSFGYLPVAGRIGYGSIPRRSSSAELGRDRQDLRRVRRATAYGHQSRMPFHVTSLDWQESDRVLAGIMTAFGSNTNAIEIGGHGEFDGVMLESFTRPRIEGRFSGDRMRAWNVVWGQARSDVVIENSYATIKNAVITAGDSEIVANGQFSLGYPRRDGGERSIPLSA